MKTKIDKDIEKCLNIVSSGKDFAFDTETTGLSWTKENPIGYSVSDGIEAVYIPTAHTGGGNIPYPEMFLKELKRRIENHSNKIIMHHAKFDMHFSQNDGIMIGNRVKDTMTRAAIINENKRGYSLDACCKEYPDIPQKYGNELYVHIAQLTNCKPNRQSMAHFHLLPGDDALVQEYAAGDTLSTKALYDKQEKHIYGENLEVVENMENELTYVLQKIERKGIGVDMNRYKEVKKRVEELQLQSYAMLPMKEDFTPINVRSSKDLKEYFETCAIDDWPITEKGNPSFGRDYLETHEEGLLIIEAKKYDHLMNGFIEPFEKYVYNGRVHTTFNQTYNEFDYGTKSGRLSCTNPNLQQVPKRDKFLGRIYRSIFVADPNYTFVEYDHSQAEPRLYAHYSGEPVLIEGYKKIPFVDMHSIAAEMMGIERSVAKNLNLGILYTMGALKLSKKLKIPFDEAKEIMKRWYRTFKHVSWFSRKANEVATDRKWVKTILGRRARFPDPRWAYRSANRIIQGSSADILKWKMVEINRWIEDNKLDDYVHMIVNIHDAILFQIHKDYVEDLVPKIGAIFTDVQGPPFNLRVPFAEEHHIGDDWAIASYGE